MEDKLLHGINDLVFVCAIFSFALVGLLAYELIAKRQNGMTSALLYREISILLLFLWSILLLAGLFPSRLAHLWVRLIVLLNYIFSVVFLAYTLGKIWMQNK